MDKKPVNPRVRYNISTIIVYVIGAILLIQLFNLQIVNGKEYREQSNTRLTRESSMEASRGNIKDRNGSDLATVNVGYGLELYKTKVENNVLNDSILKIIQILESNGDSYVDDLPITVDPFAFNTDDEATLKNWKKKYKVDEDANAEQAFYQLKEKYEITNTDVNEIRKIMLVRYKIEKDGYSSTKAVQISKNISSASVAQLTERSSEFPGTNITMQPVRTYQFGSLASHILGTVGRLSDQDDITGKEDLYTSDDTIGKTGIEYVFEDYLKGTRGTKQVDMTVDGTITDEYVAEEAEAGADIVLTIDAQLQEVTERALENNIEKIRNGGFGSSFDTNSGAAVVMNVNTGEVLAMASYPDFEPQEFVGGISVEKWNEYNAEGSGNPLINRAISAAAAPGSTFKMATAIAALESGNVGINEKINDVGVYRYSKTYNPVCWLWTSNRRGHGYLAVSDAIKHSCNYFFYEVGNRMGIETLDRYATYLGLGHKTGIELPSEKAGDLASPERAAQDGNGFYGADTLSAAIGQSYNNFTPIQMAKYTSMIANGGKKLDVTIIKNVIKSDGTELSKEEIQLYSNQKLGIQEEETEELTFNEANVKAVLEGMRGVTSESGGTAYSTFRNFNIEVGEKTGSAQVSEDVTNAWFVGFAPFDNPEIAVVVLVENGGHGSYTAEVARDIIAEYFGMNTTENIVTEDMTPVPTTQIQR